MRFILAPGMGCTPVQTSNWYSWLDLELSKRPKVSEIIVQDFPDPYGCKQSIWLPHVTDTLKVDSSTVVIGHSSGACLAMRLLEHQAKLQKPLAGVILVAAAYTDLGDENERASEYFNDPWEWEIMSQGAKSIHQFHSPSDHLIPVAEARYISEQLSGNSNYEYQEVPEKGHFFEPFQELMQVIDSKYLSLI